MLRFDYLACLLGCVALGCPSDEGLNDDGDASTSMGTSTTATSDATTTAMTAASSEDESTTTTTGDGTSGSDTESCEPGSEGCACVDDVCDEGLGCEADVCVGIGMCKSSLDAESNDVEDDAIDLGELECGVLDGVQGTIDGDDLDWFTYHGVDDGCEGSTTAIITADQELEVCVYFVCDAGNPQVVCQVGEATDSPGGHHGCCGVDNVIFDSNECLGATMNDSGTVHMSVGPVDGTSPMCTDYEVGYRFL